MLRLSAFDNCAFDVYAKDTASAAGVSNDSLQFVWGIQFIHPVFTSTTGTMVYKYSPFLVIDTLDMFTAANMAYKYPSLLTNGTYLMTLKAVDTISVSTWAAQSRSFVPQYDVYYRFWAKGMQENGHSIKMVFQATRKKYTKVGN
jgi:hypothetical protein